MSTICLKPLWTYQALDVAEPSLLKKLLYAKDHRARAAATRVLQYWQARLPDFLELLTARVADDHPRVRLEAVRALGRVPDSHAVEVAVQALDRPVDKYLDYALWLTVRELEPDWMPALQSGRLEFAGNTRDLLFALQAVGSKEGIKPLVGLLQTGKIATERQESVLLLLAAVGGPEELRMVFEQVLAADVRQARKRTNLLAALEEASRQLAVFDGAGDLSRVGKLLTAESEGVRAAAARLAGSWQRRIISSPDLGLCSRQPAPASRSEEPPSQHSYNLMARPAGKRSSNWQARRIHPDFACWPSWPSYPRISKPPDAEPSSFSRPTSTKQT